MKPGRSLKIAGAEGRDRTDTGLPPMVFETIASACSATPALAKIIAGKYAIVNEKRLKKKEA